MNGQAQEFGESHGNKLLNHFSTYYFIILFFFIGAHTFILFLTTKYIVIKTFVATSFLYFFYFNPVLSGSNYTHKNAAIASYHLHI